MQKEINKLIKQLNAEKLRKNYKECIELNNIIGGLYSEIGSYDEAIHYHQQALEHCKTLGDCLNTALCHRHIGEAKASLGNFNEAIDHIKKYLELAQNINNKVEIQRAWTTLGRIFLMQAQGLQDGDKTSAIDSTIKAIAKEAEKHFQTALNLAESVRDQVGDKEYASMSSSLLINMAILKDIRGARKEAIVKFNRAMEICRSNKLKEELYRCLSISAPIYRRWNDTKMAVKTSEEALKIAKSIGKKILICEALLELGFARICQRDFKNAKRTFAQAYLEKSPSEDDHIKAIRLTKLAHLVSTTYEKLGKQTTANEDRMKLCDKLGDLFVAIGNCYLAVEYYRQAFTSAKVCSMPKTELARLLFSIAESYADTGQYEHAFLCYKKEVTFREGNPKEQCQTYIKMAHMSEYLNWDSEKVSEQYENALSKAGEEPKLMHDVLKWYVPYLKQKCHNITRCRELQDMLKSIKSYPEVIEDIEAEDYEEINELEDEIANVDDVITDDEENDEVLTLGRRRAKGSNKFKQNEVGDTPLHEAAIKGDFKRVKSLIGQGHEVNPRDNAGWIPLHESCNHGHYQIAEYLIEHGADVNNRGLKGVSPLHDAATNGHYDIMRLLIKNGANAISLTDSGETVLSCLREYKSRNYKTMSNSEMSEYKQMEAELLNVMDKCGYNLMSENMKHLGSKSSIGSSHKRPDGPLINQKEPVSVIPLASTSKRATSSTSQSKDDTSKHRTLTDQNKPDISVKEYRSAMGALKRKRPLDVGGSNKRASQPATISANYNTSMATKQWLLDDNQVVEEDEEEDDEEDFLIAAQRRGSLKSRRRQANSKNVIDDDEDEKNDNDNDNDVLFVREERWSECDSDKKDESQKSRAMTENISDDDDDLPPKIIEKPIRGNSLQAESSSHQTTQSSRHIQAVSDILAQPLNIEIEDRKLLIPIKDAAMTIAGLKSSIVDRYSILVNARPIISLAPKSDPGCILFDADLCRDVIRENLVASVTSWQRPTIKESYLEECAKQSIEPLDFVKTEMGVLDDMGAKLDLSYVRLPASHRQTVARALTRRDFIVANLQGSVGLFETQHIGSNAQASDTMMMSIITWTKLTRLELKCVGLLRVHFELLCSARASALPELLELDVSYNSILYKLKEEFGVQVDRLQKISPKLKKLVITKNLLRFVDLFPELKCDYVDNTTIEVIF